MGRTVVRSRDYLGLGWKIRAAGVVEAGWIRDEDKEGNNRCRG